MADARPETLLIFDTATVVLEMTRGGKFHTKASGWEANRTVLEGQKIEIWTNKSRWFLARAPMRSNRHRRLSRQLAGEKR